jgi:putative peptidoglycan lipid II flippase
LLFRGLRKRQVYQPERGWIRLWVAVILACTTMAALLLFMTHDTERWLQASAVLRVKDLGLTIIFGVIVYVFTCMVAGLKKHDLLRGAK